MSQQQEAPHSDRSIKAAHTELHREIGRKIRSNALWAMFDFVFGETLLWAALLSSIAAAVAVNFDGVPKWVLGLLAGVLPFVLLTERVFRFTERCQWHQTYIPALEQLLHELRDQGVDISEVSKKFDELSIKKQSEFPQRNPTALQSSKQ
jgi:hypothetical protein